MPGELRDVSRRVRRCAFFCEIKEGLFRKWNVKMENQEAPSCTDLFLEKVHINVDLKTDYLSIPV